MNHAYYYLRDYCDDDYSTCETLVDNAWQFQQNFSPPEFADLLKYLYTMGSIASSNFRLVATHHNEVVAFIFGYNNKKKLPPHDLHKFAKKLSLTKRFFLLKNVSLKEKLRFLKAMGTHEKNKSSLLQNNNSEIILFVVSPQHQAKGIGKRLFAAFLQQCQQHQVKSIIVETNSQGAAGFYQTIGFQLLNHFDSPLHDYIENYGQASLYEYIL